MIDTSGPCSLVRAFNSAVRRSRAGPTREPSSATGSSPTRQNVALTAASHASGARGGGDGLAAGPRSPGNGRQAARDGRLGGFDVSALSVLPGARTVATSHSDGPRFFVDLLLRIAAGAEAWALARLGLSAFRGLTLPAM